MEPPKADTLSGRALRKTVAAALRLPRPVAKRIFGEPPVNDRGAPLDWQTHLLLRLMATTGSPELHELGAEQARTVYDRANALFDLKPRPMHAIEELSVAGADSTLSMRVYRPAPGPLPACVFFHGGGYVIGSYDGYEGFCSAFAELGQCVVLSVDYRLAPEFPFPAAPRDCQAAFNDIWARREELGIDGARLGVAGDSAGGNLAAVVAQQQLVDDGALPAHQLLIYPKTDQGTDYPSHNHFGDGFLLTQEMVSWFGDCYKAASEDPRCSPIRFERLAELPPTTVITAGFDPLRDEGEAYAEKLQAAGAEVSHYCCDQLIHGFVTQGGVVDAAAAAVADMAEQFRRAISA